MGAFNKRFLISKSLNFFLSLLNYVIIEHILKSWRNLLLQVQTYIEGDFKASRGRATLHGMDIG